jgi:hypothetical protein
VTLDDDSLELGSRLEQQQQRIKVTLWPSSSHKHGQQQDPTQAAAAAQQAAEEQAADDKVEQQERLDLFVVPPRRISSSPELSPEQMDTAGGNDPVNTVSEFSASTVTLGAGLAPVSGPGSTGSGTSGGTWFMPGRGLFDQQPPAIKKALLEVQAAAGQEVPSLQRPGGSVSNASSSAAATGSAADMSADLANLDIAHLAQQAPPLTVVCRICEASWLPSALEAHTQLCLPLRQLGDGQSCDAQLLLIIEHIEAHVGGGCCCCGAAVLSWCLQCCSVAAVVMMLS